MIYTVYAPPALITIPNPHISMHTHIHTQPLCLYSRWNHTTLRHGTHCYSFLCVIECFVLILSTVRLRHTLARFYSLQYGCFLFAVLWGERTTSNMIQQCVLLRRGQSLYSLLNLKALQWKNKKKSITNEICFIWCGGKIIFFKPWQGQM